MSNADISDTDARPVAESRGPLWFLAALPPPLNGQSNCNRAMQDILQSHVDLTLLDPGRTRLGKLWCAVANAVALMVHGRRGRVAYISIPGQNGVWLLLLAILAMRVRGMTMWFHHHSFRPINQGPLRAMRALVACAGSRQHHILLSERMRERFAALYLPGRAKAALAFSNTVLFPPDCRKAIATRPERPLTLGHVSVLTRAKGIYHLLDLFEVLQTGIPDLRMIIAGPSDDADLLKAVRRAVERHPDAVEYRGAVAGDEKARFYRDIDAFILPTTLIDEAEPLVMIEAYEQGVEVFASATGCIPDRIRKRGHLLTLNLAEDSERIAPLARLSGQEWADRRKTCRAHVCELTEEAREQGQTVLARLLEPVCPSMPEAGVAMEHTLR